MRALLAPIAVDVRRRQGIAIAAALALGQWMIRSHPPWEVRALAYLATPEARAPWIVGVLAVVLFASRSWARRLLCAKDIRLLRHLPIGAWTWRWIHGTQLLALDVPLHVAALYGLWPVRARGEAIAWLGATIAGLLAVRVLGCAIVDRGLVVRAAIGGLAIAIAVLLVVIADPWLALAVAVLGAGLAVRRLGGAMPEPRPAGRARVVPLPHPVLARAWVQLSIAWHRDRVHVSVSCAMQVVAIAVGSLAAAHVSVVEARWAVLLAACTAAAMALWSAVRCERALADDRWVLDPHVGARATDLGGRMLAAAVLASPLVVATLVERASLVVALVAAAWVAAVAVELVTRAELRRTLRRPQVLALTVRIAIAIAAALVLGVLGLALHAVLSTLLAARRWAAADLGRRRFARLPGEIEAAVS